MRTAGANACKEKVEKEAVTVKATQVGASKATKKQLKRIEECGIWISMTPHELNGTILTRDQWMKNAWICYRQKQIGFSPSPYTGAAQTSPSSMGSAARKRGVWALGMTTQEMRPDH